jgi:hypothetical protein
MIYRVSTTRSRYSRYSYDSDESKQTTTRFDLVKGSHQAVSTAWLSEITRIARLILFIGWLHIDCCWWEKKTVNEWHDRYRATSVSGWCCMTWIVTMRWMNLGTVIGWHFFEKIDRIQGCMREEGRKFGMYIFAMKWERVWRIEYCRSYSQPLGCVKSLVVLFGK